MRPTEPPYVVGYAHVTSEASAILQAVSRVRGVSLGQLVDRALADALTALVNNSSADVALDRRRAEESDRLYAIASGVEDKARAREMRKYAAKIRSGEVPLPSATREVKGI
jgi:hypothetical protein